VEENNTWQLKEGYKDTPMLLRVSKDRVCGRKGCENKLNRESKLYCNKCKEERSEYFKRQYYLKMGWELPN